MKDKKSFNIEGLDWMTTILFMMLVAIGWLMIYTVGYSDVQDLPLSKFMLKTPPGKQLIFIGVCTVLFAAIQVIDWKFWRTFAFVIYVLSLVLLVLVLFFGNNIKGATSWFSIGGFSYQPAEFAKFGTALALSSYLSNYGTSLKNMNHQFISFGLFLMPVILILLQPDAGSALVFFSFLIVLYREGLSLSYYLVGAFIAVMFILGLVISPKEIAFFMILIEIIILAIGQKYGYYALLVGAALTIFNYFVLNDGWWIGGFAVNGTVLGLVMYLRYAKRQGKFVSFSIVRLIAGVLIVISANFFFNNVLQAHQQDRINAWLKPSKCDPRGSLYNVLQSKMAIGSGGLEGKGFLEGNMTRLNYVPEQNTDFIFCTVGEEQGFMGTFALIAMFLILLIRITVIAERQRSDFSRHYAYGVAGIIFIHIFTNIGMTMGLVPIIGIPLPFISYGGSSLLGFTMLMAVLLKLDSKRSSI